MKNKTLLKILDSLFYRWKTRESHIKIQITIHRLSKLQLNQDNDSYTIHKKMGAIARWLLQYMKFKFIIEKFMVPTIIISFNDLGVKDLI